MGIQKQLIMTVYIVNFGLIPLQTLNQMIDQAVPSIKNDESTIQENTFFDSIGKNNTNKNGIYHEILKQELAREQKAFNMMKEELEIARDKNGYKKRNFYEESNIRENVMAAKRETDEGHCSPGYTKFKMLLDQARSIVVITGEGISVESGIPMLIRGVNSYYKNHKVKLLMTWSSFQKNPSLVWDFFEYRRKIILNKKPNKAHYALVDFEKFCQKEGRNFTLITQNMDGLHKMAGSQNVHEIYGSIFKTKCTVCNSTFINVKSPICPAFGQRVHKPNITRFYPIPTEKLPRCGLAKCGGLLRPDVTFFGEDLHEAEENMEESLRECDLLLLIGNSAEYYPVNEYVNHILWKKVPVAEFSTEATRQSSLFQFHFSGAYTKTVPEALTYE